jgi:hypothetical protein
MRGGALSASKQGPLGGTLSTVRNENSVAAPHFLLRLIRLKPDGRKIKAHGVSRVG